MTPQELRKEASAAEFLATLVSVRDKDWLRAKAALLRRKAELQERRPWRAA